VSEDVRSYLSSVRERIDRVLDELLPRPDQPPGRLHEAMRYSVLAPGKRLRPALALAACRSFAGDEEACLRPAAALEMIHAYSLIHDDLPAMDDDDMRRGQPTSHVVYGEAMAILAGDALHTLACEVLATHPAGDEHASLRSRVQLAVLQAIGWRGMVGGQVLDIELTGRPEAGTLDEVREVHSRKTGALIRASLVMGAEVGGAPPSAVEHQTGGKDEAAGKLTYPAVVGLERSRAIAASLTREARDLLDGTEFPPSGDAGALRALTQFILERTH
jgi:geranylgeranyl pyrophosphate synthase